MEGSSKVDTCWVRCKRDAPRVNLLMEQPMRRPPHPTELLTAEREKEPVVV